MNVWRLMLQNKDDAVGKWLHKCSAWNWAEATSRGDAWRESWGSALGLHVVCAVWEEGFLASVQTTHFTTHLVTSLRLTPRLGPNVPKFQFLIDGPVTEVEDPQEYATNIFLSLVPACLTFLYLMETYFLQLIKIRESWWRYRTFSVVTYEM
jgi:hypothetical protein